MEPFVWKGNSCLNDTSVANDTKNKCADPSGKGAYGHSRTVSEAHLSRVTQKAFSIIEK